MLFCSPLASESCQEIARRRGPDAVLPVVGLALPQPLRQRERALERGADGVGHDRRLRDAAEPGAHGEDRRRPAVEHVHLGGADVELVERHDPGQHAEQARPVRRPDGDLLAVGDVLDADAHGDGAVLRGLRRRRGDLRPGRVQHRLGLPRTAGPHGALHAGDQRRDEVRLPRRPGRRAGGRAVGLGERVQQLQQRRVAAEGLADPRDGGRVVDVAPGGGVGQQQVVADHRREGGHVHRREAHAGRHLGADRLADDAVVARASPLPMSCSSAPTSSRSGRSTSRVSSAAAAAASTRWRSTVKRCQGWRCGSDRTRSHSGSSRAQQTLLVQLLDHRHRAAAAGQQPQERPPDLRRPRLGHRRAVHGQHLQRVGREQQVGPGGGGRAAQHQPGVGGRPGVAGEHDLVALADDALGERLAVHPAVAAARTADQRRLHPPPRLVGDEGQPPSGQADLAQQGVLVGQPQGGRDGSLLLADQHVGGAAGAAAELVADVEQEGVGLLGLAGGLVGQLGRGDRAQHLALAQPAVGLLEVGLEQEGQLPDPAGRGPGAGRAAGAAAGRPTGASCRGWRCAAGRPGRRPRRPAGRRGDPARP